MSLPPVSLPRAIVHVDGVEVEVRGLSRSEAVRLAEMASNPDEAENYLLAWGAGVSEDEARQWRNDAPAMTVGALVDRIVELSGLDEGAQKSG